ncbi:hypothetical protein H2203_005318 [Taxawa tesnikishii (nom. ined.)]|nr:hypothetical protein H2203_005318 [Dothideales sp. JES 119]
MFFKLLVALLFATLALAVPMPSNDNVPYRRDTTVVMSWSFKSDKRVPIWVRPMTEITSIETLSAVVEKRNADHLPSMLNKRSVAHPHWFLDHETRRFTEMQPAQAKMLMQAKHVI